MTDMPEDERVDAIRYGLHAAIVAHEQQCQEGQRVALSSLPTERAATAFESMLASHGAVVVASDALTSARAETERVGRERDDAEQARRDTADLLVKIHAELVEVRTERGVRIATLEQERDEANARLAALVDPSGFGPQTPEEWPVFLREARIVDDELRAVLRARIATLEAALREAKVLHSARCADNFPGGCHCGASAHNARIDQALAAQDGRVGKEGDGG